MTDEKIVSAKLPVWPEGVRCEACRWWDMSGRPYPLGGDKGPRHLCLLTESTNTVAACPDSQAVAIDIEEYSGAGLQTLGTFACNQFEEKT